MEPIENKVQTSGFVIQPRLHFSKLIDKLIYQYFIDIANYQSKKVCGRGQLIFSIHSFSEEIGWPYGSIRGALKRLVDAGYITLENLPQKRGFLITVLDYSRYQNLENYTFSNKENSKQSNKETNKGTESTNAYKSNDEDTSKTKVNKELHKEDNEQTNNTLTSLNSINNNIRTYKDLRRYCQETLPQITSTADAESFVNLLLVIDDQITIKCSLLVRYIDLIRMTRATCKISTNILINIIERAMKFEVDVIHYALLTHILNHDDKREKYTLGIMRNTDVHEARRRLMKLMNKYPGEEVPSSEGTQRSNGYKYDYGF